MNTPSSRTVGASRTAASNRSFSRNRVRGGAGWDAGGGGSAASSPAAPPAPPAMGFFNEASALVDLLQFPLGPLHGVFGLHALDRLRVHVDDDVLGVHLGRLGGRRSGVSEDPRVAGGRAEHLEGLGDLVPHGALFPRRRG